MIKFESEKKSNILIVLNSNFRAKIVAYNKYLRLKTKAKLNVKLWSKLAFGLSVQQNNNKTEGNGVETRNLSKPSRRVGKLLEFF